MHVKSLVGIVAGLGAIALATVTLAQERLLAERRASLDPYNSNALADLGERLFFDVRLSRTGTTACASCHQPAHAYSDPRRVSVADSGTRGRRNAPSLINVGFFPYLMWDGRFRTLEQQALSPFHRGEMGITVQEAVRRLHADAVYVDLFHGALHRHPTADGMARALAAYQRTLVSGESRAERFLRSGDATVLSSLERDGLAIFDTQARCTSCHRLARPTADPWDEAPLLLTDFRFHNLGIGYRSGQFADPGRYAISRDEADLGAFRTPSLRNLSRTGPYMHDGSLPTLVDVVDFYNAGGRRNPNLSPLIRPLALGDYERAALVAFLRALSDGQFDAFGAVSRW